MHCWFPIALAFVAAACPAPPVKPLPPKPVVTAPAIIDAPLAPRVAPDVTEPKLRLPRNFTPTSYTAKLAIDPAKPTFEGSIAIAGTIGERSPVIWLHGYKLVVHRATASRGEVVALVVTPHGEDLLEGRADPPLEPGAWTL